MLGRQLEEAHALVVTIGERRGRLRVLRHVGLDERVDRLVAGGCRRGASVDALIGSCSSAFVGGCTLFGRLSSTLAVLCTQHRWSRVVGHTSRMAAQTPSAPSPTMTSGASTSRFFTSRGRSAPLYVDSRTPSSNAISSFVPSGRAPSLTSAQRRSSSRRTPK